MAKNKLQLLQNLIEIPDILILVKNFRKCRSQLADQQIDNAEFLIKGRFLDCLLYTSHTLGAVYDTPHGVACAMMLPIVMEYNQECTGEKYREIARAMGVKGVDAMTQEEYRKAAIDAVKQLSEDVGIPSKLDAIKEEDLQFLADSAFALSLIHILSYGNKQTPYKSTQL